MVKFIDLFCGIGGIRLGMEAQGFNLKRNRSWGNKGNDYYLGGYCE